VVEQGPQRDVEPGGELVHRLQGGGERSPLDAPDGVHRQRAALRQLLLGEAAGVAECPDVDAEALSHVRPHELSHPRARLDDTRAPGDRADVPGGTRQIVRMRTVRRCWRRIPPVHGSHPFRGGQGECQAAGGVDATGAAGALSAGGTPGSAPAVLSTSVAAKRVPATWKAKRTQSATWATTRARSASPA